MKKNLSRTIELPEGFSAKMENDILTIKGNNQEASREFLLNRISLVVKDSKIELSAEKATKRESTMMGTSWAHINNIIKGLGEGFTYKLEICNGHFPMNVKKEGNKVVIKSFLGETTKRIAKILPKVEVEINGNKITVKSSNIESAGQTAANLEKATRLNNKDRRIFQDGIFITEKCGREI